MVCYLVDGLRCGGEMHVGVCCLVDGLLFSGWFVV